LGELNTDQVGLATEITQWSTVGFAAASSIAAGVDGIRERKARDLPTILFIVFMLIGVGLIVFGGLGQFKSWGCITLTGPILQTVGVGSMILALLTGMSGNRGVGEKQFQIVGEATFTESPLKAKALERKQFEIVGEATFTESTLKAKAAERKQKKKLHSPEIVGEAIFTESPLKKEAAARKQKNNNRMTLSQQQESQTSSPEMPESAPEAPPAAANSAPIQTTKVTPASTNQGKPSQTSSPGKAKPGMLDVVSGTSDKGKKQKKKIVEAENKTLAKIAPMRCPKCEGKCKRRGNTKKCKTCGNTGEVLINMNTGKILLSSHRRLASPSMRRLVEDIIRA